ncbi:hypothetical protein WIT60_05885 [Aquabacterium sp. G14]|uniref:hypothetical protein n=1 Tax=Aquabacterium sp. G14 TaxID=3130164 RepID=UPI0030A26C9E
MFAKHPHSRTRYTFEMRRWFAIFLLVLMPLQAVWSAAVPYCQHESAPSQSRHLGHHQHHDHADVDGAQSHEHGKSDTGKGIADLDHDHHCWSFASMLPDAQGLSVPPPQAQSATSPLAAYTSFDAHHIDRPNWRVSL